MKNKLAREMVLSVAIAFLVFGSASAQASLTPKESETIQAIVKACKDRRQKVDEFLKRYPANGAFSDAMVTEGFAILSRPSVLPQSYWTIRDRAASYPIKDVTSAREFSAMDGRVGQAEISCSGHIDARAWRTIADRAIAAKRADNNFRKRFLGVWKTWVNTQIHQPITYSQYTNIIETANRLNQRRMISVPRGLSDSIRQMDAQIAKAAPAKPAPQLSNPQDPKWIDWAKTIQIKSRKERELLPVAQKALSALAK